MNSLRQALDAAWQYYRRGEWQQAEQLYLQALKINPEFHVLYANEARAWTGVPTSNLVGTLSHN